MDYSFQEQLNKNYRYQTKDVFTNDTEYDSFSDYSRFSHELVNDKELDTEPQADEITRVKKNYSIASMLMVLYSMGLEVVAVAFISVFSGLMNILYSFTDVSHPGEKAFEYVYGQTGNEIINIVVLTSMNLLFYILGTRFCKIDRTKLFYPGLKERGFNVTTAAVLVFTALFIQIVMGYASVFLNDIMSSGGVENYNPNFEITTFSSFILTCLYGLILAPVTEELLYRGFILKAFSAVSQKTGIWVSAIFFSLAHQNTAQALLALPGGLLMGYVAVKYNSLIPGMIVHFFINLSASIYQVIIPFFIGYTENVIIVVNIFSVVVFVLGIVSICAFFFSAKFPKTVAAQKKRNKALMACVFFWAFIGINVGKAILIVMRIN